MKFQQIMTIGQDSRETFGSLAIFEKSENDEVEHSTTKTFFFCLRMKVNN